MASFRRHPERKRPVSAILGPVAPAEHLRPEQINAEQLSAEQLSAEQIGRALRTFWRRTPDRCVAIRTGLHSCTWQVDVGDEHFAAKVMPAGMRAQMEAGMFAADRLERDGFSAGRPVRAVDGALTVPVERAAVGLLTWVPGRALVAADGLDQQWWGDTLGAAHKRLHGLTHPGLVRFQPLRVEAAHLDVEPWVRPAVAGAVASAKKRSVTDQLTYGVLHGDPAPDAFRLDPTSGRTGLVDWGLAAIGPLAYDIASAVMYAGGIAAADQLIEAYLAAGPVPEEELDAALPSMLRLRWAVEADYAAHRLAADLAAGVLERPGDRAPLHLARDALGALDRAERAAARDDPD